MKKDPTRSQMTVRSGQSTVMMMTIGGITWMKKICTPLNLTVRYTTVLSPTPTRTKFWVASHGSSSSSHPGAGIARG